MVSLPSDKILTLVLLNLDMPDFANSVDPDQLASEPTDLDLHYLSLFCEFVLTTWIKSYNWLKIRSGRGILIYSAEQGLRQHLKIIF